MKYSCNDQSLRIFDVLDVSTGRYLDYDSAKAIADDLKLEWVPILYRGSWKRDELLSLCEGKTTIGKGDHCREGFVVRPTTERWDRRVGRVVLKMVGSDYLLRKSDKS